MNQSKAFSKGYTHCGTMYGIYGYFRFNSNMPNKFIGKYMLTNLLVSIVLIFKHAISNDHNIPMKITAKLINIK